MCPGKQRFQNKERQLKVKLKKKTYVGFIFFFFLISFIISSYTDSGMVIEKLKNEKCKDFQCTEKIVAICFQNGVNMYY